METSPLWKEIKRIRKSKGITQERLAALSGVSAGTIASLESGHNQDANIATIKKVCDALEISISSLYISAGIDKPITTERNIQSLLNEVMILSEKKSVVEIPIKGYIIADKNNPDCGDVILEDSGKYVVVPKEVLKLFEFTQIYALAVRGDSMKKIGARDGDFLLIDPTDRTITQGKPYILKMIDKLILRRIFKNNNHYELISCQDTLENVDSVEVLGRAVKRISEVDL